MTRFQLEKRRRNLKGIARSFEALAYVGIGASTYGPRWWTLVALAAFVARIFVVRRIEMVKVEIDEANDAEYRATP